MILYMLGILLAIVAVISMWTGGWIGKGILFLLIGSLFCWFHDWGFRVRPGCSDWASCNLQGVGLVGTYVAVALWLAFISGCLAN